MPFVEGESLRQRLQREPRLSVDDAVTLAGEVAEALTYAHARVLPSSAKASPPSWSVSSCARWRPTLPLGSLT
jgi:hypothetical protein